MRNYFEEMNIDYNELKRYEDIETYYDEVEDYTKLIKELQCNRVEALKQIVNKNREIERLNNIINRTTEYVESLSSSGRGCDIYDDIKQEILKELKGVDKE